MDKYRNRILIGLFIALVIYIGLLLLVDNQGKITGEVLTAMRDYPLGMLLLAGLCQTLTGVFRFWEWHYYMGVIGARDKMSLLDSAVIFVFGFVMVVTPGKAGELLKSVFVKLKTGVPIARSAPVVLAERVVDGLAVIAILAVVLVVAGEQLNLGEFLGLAQTLVWSTALFLVLCLIAVQIQPLAYFMLGLVAKIPFIRRFQVWLTALYESSREVFNLRHVIPVAMMGVGVYLSSAFALVCILYGFNIPMTTTTVLQAMFIIGVGSAIGALSFVPNGAGVTEISNATMIMAILAPEHPQITLGVAMAIALLEGFFHKWYRVIVGVAVGVIFRQTLFSSGLEAELAQAEMATGD